MTKEQNYINEKTKSFFEGMVNANTNAFEQGDFERKERKENPMKSVIKEAGYKEIEKDVFKKPLTAEQEDSLEIMNEPETEAFNQHQEEQTKHYEPK